jgi:hypothetical protein
VGRKVGVNPSGRKPLHGSRALERVLKENLIDQRTTTARMLRQIRQDLAEDAGGEAALTNRERTLIDRTSCVLLLCSSIENWAFSQKELLTDGALPNVLATNYLSYVNTARLKNLISLGLKPSRPDAEPDLSTYLQQQKQLPQEAEIDDSRDSE